MTENIKHLLSNNGEEFKEEILNLIKEIPQLMDESHVYDTYPELIDTGDEEALMEFVTKEYKYYLALGYILAKNGKPFWDTVLGK